MSKPSKLFCDKHNAPTVPNINKGSGERIGWICKLCKNEYSRKYHSNNVDVRHEKMLRSRYGLTKQDFNLILESQGGRCDICRTDDPGHGRGRNNFLVDHDHFTGKVRGLLCLKCNSGLGMFKDSIDIATSAISYLRKHGSKG